MPERQDRYDPRRFFVQVRNSVSRVRKTQHWLQIGSSRPNFATKRQAGPESVRPWGRHFGSRRCNAALLVSSWPRASALVIFAEAAAHRERIDRVRHPVAARPRGHRQRQALPCQRGIQLDSIAVARADNRARSAVRIFGCGVSQPVTIDLGRPERLGAQRGEPCREVERRNRLHGGGRRHGCGARSCRAGCRFGRLRCLLGRLCTGRR